MIIFLLILLLALAAFSLFIAAGTLVVKKIYFRNQANRSTSKRNITNEGFQGNPKDGVKWYPTGWTFNDRTGKWQAPDYLRKESQTRWKWDPDKKIWVDKDKEARLEKYKKYHEGQPPTFEEWKAAREKENQGESNNT